MRQMILFLVNVRLRTVHRQLAADRFRPGYGAAIKYRRPSEIGLTKKMILFLVVASWMHIGCCLNPVEGGCLLFRFVWWLDCLLKKKTSSLFLSLETGGWTDTFPGRWREAEVGSLVRQDLDQILVASYDVELDHFCEIVITGKCRPLKGLGFLHPRGENAQVVVMHTGCKSCEDGLELLCSDPDVLQFARQDACSRT